ncbi:MAG: low affinity iron permease family protein, partial [Bryocella sp.]
MTYNEVLDKLAALGPEVASKPGQPPRKYTLDNIRLLLAELGDPQQSFASVLIAGTNGKGSTAATLAAICSVAGIRTGLYTSPHLSRVNERIRRSAPNAGGLLGEIADESFAAWASGWLGSKWAFAVAGLVIIIWGITGPMFHYSNTWQLIINTGTTIVTFLMV